MKFLLKCRIKKKAHGNFLMKQLEIPRNKNPGRNYGREFVETSKEIIARGLVEIPGITPIYSFGKIPGRSPGEASRRTSK